MNGIPEPGDPCQWGEHDCEVVKFDAKHEIVWVLILDGEYEDEIRALVYRAADWQ